MFVTLLCEESREPFKDRQLYPKITLFLDIFFKFQVILSKK